MSWGDGNKFAGTAVTIAAFCNSSEQEDLILLDPTNNETRVNQEVHYYIPASYSKEVRACLHLALLAEVMVKGAQALEEELEGLRRDWIRKHAEMFQQVLPTTFSRYERLDYSAGELFAILRDEVTILKQEAARKAKI